MRKSVNIPEVLRGLFATHEVAVLGTVRQGRPYQNLVAFVATADLRCLLFATDRRTRKYSNLAAGPDVAMLVDNRATIGTDFGGALAVTAFGQAGELVGPTREDHVKLFLARHPHLAGFVSAETCALFCVSVSTYRVAAGIDKISEYSPLA